MKICPRCQKTYTDDNLNFCLEDGSTLQQMSGGAPPPTVQMNPPSTNPNQPMAGQQQAWNTPQQYAGQPRKKSRAWIWVLLILGLVIVICSGGFGLLAYIGYKVDQENSNKTVSANSSTNTTTGTTGNKSTSTTSTSSTRSDITTVDFNMFTKSFSIYGTTTYDGDELKVKAGSLAAYYVLATPDKSDYKSEEADTSITVRNTTGAACTHGYGLVFHSDPTPLEQDYAFLIDTKRQKYTLVRHEPDKERGVIAWTSSTAINGGTAENTLEVRDHDKTIDLYINDTKVNSVPNTFGYPSGVVGIYVGQGPEIAFKDFQIKR